MLNFASAAGDAINNQWFRRTMYTTLPRVHMTTFSLLASSIKARTHPDDCAKRYIQHIFLVDHFIVPWQAIHLD